MDTDAVRAPNSSVGRGPMGVERQLLGHGDTGLSLPADQLTRMRGVPFGNPGWTLPPRLDLLVPAAIPWRLIIAAYLGWAFPSGDDERRFPAQLDAASGPPAPGTD